jgi:hypothetical protein
MSMAKEIASPCCISKSWDSRDIGLERPPKTTIDTHHKNNLPKALAGPYVQATPASKLIKHNCQGVIYFLLVGIASSEEFGAWIFHQVQIPIGERETDDKP